MKKYKTYIICPGCPDRRYRKITFESSEWIKGAKQGIRHKLDEMSPSEWSEGIYPFMLPGTYFEDACPECAALVLLENFNAGRGMEKPKNDPTWLRPPHYRRKTARYWKVFRLTQGDIVIQLNSDYLEKHRKYEGNKS
jgi:hypothetical protein